MNDLVIPSTGNRCAFCDYLEGTRPYVFLWHEESVAVAVTLEQRGIAHLLVLPTEHTPTLLELRDGTARDLMIALRDAASAIDAAFGCPGIAVWQNNGTPAGQAVPHLHFHVAGTLPGGGTEFDPVPEISITQAQEVARRLAPFVLAGKTTTSRRILTFE